MLRDSAACLFLSELIKGKYDFGGVLNNMLPDVFFPETQKMILYSRLYQIVAEIECEIVHES